jgi:hypothetical protein
VSRSADGVGALTLRPRRALLRGRPPQSRGGERREGVHVWKPFILALLLIVCFLTGSCRNQASPFANGFDQAMMVAYEYPLWPAAFDSEMVRMGFHKAKYVGWERSDAGGLSWGFWSTDDSGFVLNFRPRRPPQVASGMLPALSSAAERVVSDNDAGVLSFHMRPVELEQGDEHEGRRVYTDEVRIRLAGAQWLQTTRRVRFLRGNLHSRKARGF